MDKPIPVCFTCEEGLRGERLDLLSFHGHWFCSPECVQEFRGEVVREAEDPATVGPMLRRIGSIVREWRRGCSCADVGKPEQCRECTRGAFVAIADTLAGQNLQEVEPPPAKPYTFEVDHHGRPDCEVLAYDEISKAAYRANRDWQMVAACELAETRRDLYELRRLL